MLGFLVKVLVIAGLVAGAGYYITNKGVNVKLDTQAVLGITKNIDVSSVSGQISQMLDSLVTKSNSPVILGVQVSSQTIGLVTDAIMKLPNDQLDKVREVVCK